MTETLAEKAEAVERTPSLYHFAMVEPSEFDVVYEINPWMATTDRPDRELALAQWRTLVDAYRAYGHTVEIIPGVPGLPDMVFAANGGLSVGGIFYTAKFSTEFREAEGPLHAEWQRANTATKVVEATFVNEGEGDYIALGDRVLAGYGFRSTIESHRELEEAAGREVVSLHLVDSRFYHLDTALCVLDEARGLIAYFPGAFDDDSRATLERLYPDAVKVSAQDAEAFAMNSVSDGKHVFHAGAAREFGRIVEELGFVSVPLDLSQFLKAGGGIKCCTMTLRD
ncbi:arginine deiminase-related protein [Rarobacter faecitabidus]|uniref:N-dimethylarginine dimethylaminohydrolase n=1 Tax=Rarobacter faecitabidus TaxID=13243 RepID=A0A542ZA81_RARFA|nr:dimethylargininase [Rarobacter faecitabidus]TQL57233.1 N-dimethylarginine dimethylaminohydrolase [Rarobacter faecitabidus]